MVYFYQQNVFLSLLALCIFSLFHPSSQWVPSGNLLSLKQRNNFGGNYLVPKMATSSTPPSEGVIETVTAPSSSVAKEKDDTTTIKAAKEATFEDAQVLGQKLATLLTKSCSNGEEMPEEAIRTLRALISTTSGARGWFVQLLTDPDYEAIFTQPQLDTSLLKAICDNPQPNIKLMTMNVAMSTATELVHLRNNNPEFAAGSRLTRDRSRIIIEALLDGAMVLPGLQEELVKLRSAVEPWGKRKEKEVPPPDSNPEWVKFTKKWGYNAEQRAAILEQLDQILQ